MEAKTSRTEQPRKEADCLVIQIPHVSQLAEWDCGLACVLALCQAVGLLMDYEEVLADVGTQSIWTADLASVLCDYGFSVHMYTITFGVDMSLASNPYYQQGWDEDEHRIAQLFSTASQRGLQITQTSVSLSDLINWLCQDAILVLLVDKRLLSCQICPISQDTEKEETKLKEEDYFIGHFILLTRFTADAGASSVTQEGVFEYLDPARGPERCEVKADVLEAARLSHGTDEDVLVVTGLLQLARQLTPASALQ